jgi:hypothetical protein
MQRRSVDVNLSKVFTFLLKGVDHPFERVHFTLTLPEHLSSHPVFSGIVLYSIFSFICNIFLDGLCRANGCEPWWAMLSQWLWIMVCYDGPVGGNHGVLCWATGCESWSAMLSQWLWIVVSYAEPVVVNHGVLCWATGCELWCVMLSQWLWIIVSYDICQWSPWITTTRSA